jgi:GNAT superfamily N-acetyltransferase
VRLSAGEAGIRPATPDDLPFMWEMLYQAAFVPDDVRAQWKSQPSPPDELARYLDGWGRAGDEALLAEDAGVPVGAAWYRLFGADERGAGIIALPDTPELAIAVVPERRGQGVGGALLRALASTARASGYRRLVLSVDPANPARRLYERHGYVAFPAEPSVAGTSIMMAADV